MTLGERIKKVRKEEDLTQQSFGKRIGIKPNSISLIESNNRNASDQVILAICREFGISETWLRTGDGEMFAPAPCNALEALAEEYHLSHSSYILIEKFLGLKPEIQQAFVDYAVKVAAALAEDGASPQGSYFLDSEDAIEAEVASYRQQLLDEKERAEKLSASPGTKEA